MPPSRPGPENPSPGHANQEQEDDSTSFSWSDTLHIAFASCSSALPSLPPASSCFPCIRRIPSADSLQNQGASGNPQAGILGIPRARPDELQGLLAPSSSVSSFDDEFERMSLHSNPGAGRRRRRNKKGKNKKITLFGFDLFNIAGRKRQAVHLGEEDEALYGISPTSTSGPASASTSTLAVPPGDATPPNEDQTPNPKSTKPKSDRKGDTPRLTSPPLRARFDSDAAPLSSAVIESLALGTPLHSSPALPPPGGLLGREEEGEFEGFQGSGGPLGGSAPSMAKLLSSRRVRSSGSSSSGTSRSASTSRTGSAFGQFVAAPSLQSTATSLPGSPFPLPSSSSSAHAGVPSMFTKDLSRPGTTATHEIQSAFHKDEAEEDEVDLDGQLYSGPKRAYRGSSGSRSDSRSRASGSAAGGGDLGGQGGQGHGERGSGHSRSGSTSYSYSALPSPLGFPSPSSEYGENTPTGQKKKKKRSSRTSRTSRSGSTSQSVSNKSASTSQSTSLASPTSPSEFSMGFPSFAIEEHGGGEGFFDHADSLSPHTPSHAPRSDFPSPGFHTPSRGTRGTFPTAGFGTKGTTGKARDMAKMFSGLGVDMRRGEEFEGF